MDIAHKINSLSFYSTTGNKHCTCSQYIC